MSGTQGLFITGTGTNVGKTLVTCALVRMLREQGLDAIGFKPIATGEVAGSWGDAVALHESSGRCEPIEKICPLRFALPLAPTIAAQREGIEPDLALTRSILVHLCERHPVVIVEGVGGILVPLDQRTLVVDFAAQVGFPVLIVCNAALGTINHTLLTIREVERSRLKIAGIIMNVTSAADGPMVNSSKDEIERVSGNKVIAVVPNLGANPNWEAPNPALVARAIAALARQIHVRDLLGGEGEFKGSSDPRFRRRRSTDV